MNVQKIEATGYTFTDGGICAAKGIRANGLNCGLNPNKEKFDLALFASDAICESAAVYTSNKVKGAPILVTRDHMEKSGAKMRAVIANSKNANTCNANGVEIAEQMCGLAATALGIKPEEVAVASTGVIGCDLSIEPFETHIDALAKGLTYDGGHRAEYAIMTTDTVAKELAVTFTLGGKECHLGGMAKGSGMINPKMATTLNFITTDADIESALLQKALSEITKVTYNCISVDGDTSTNDMILVMANGLSENEKITEANAVLSDGFDVRTDAPKTDYEIFCKALWLVLVNFARMLAADGEGAGKLLTCEVTGAVDRENGIKVAKSVINSPLVKCAMFGRDANCGRIMCAMGYADAEADVNKADIDLCSAAGQMPAYRDGFAVAFDEDFALKVLSEEEIIIKIRLYDGDAKATAWGCDLTYDYVKINGDYRS